MHSSNDCDTASLKVTFHSWCDQRQKRFSNATPFHSLSLSIYIYSLLLPAYMCVCMYAYFDLDFYDLS